MASASATPKARPSPGPASVSGTGISSFMLDARTPGGAPSNYQEEERKREEEVEEEADRLLMETRWWRIANSAQWVAWGIVQANVPELDEEDKKQESSESSALPTLDNEEGQGPKGEVDGQADDSARTKEESKDKPKDEANDEEEFDYITYAQERAMFFWGDCVDLGLVKKEDLPENLRERIKVIGY